MGSLIKSPGGTIVSSGGYIAGRADLVAAAAARLTAPGVGVDAGSVSGETLRLMAQGTHVVPCVLIVVNCIRILTCSAAARRA